MKPVIDEVILDDSDSDDSAELGPGSPSSESEVDDAVSLPDSDSDDGGTGELIQKEFMGASPSDDDLEGMEALCKQLLKHMNVDVAEFAKILVEQSYATTLMKAAQDEGMMDPDEEEDNTVYGVYGAINLLSKKNNSAVKQLVKVMLEAAQKSTDVSATSIFETVLNEPNVGFLIKEKIVNIPGVASPPFLHQLRNDMREATSKGMPYDFKKFIHIAKVVRLDKGGEYYIDEDDEIINKNCLAKVDYSYDEARDSEVIFQNKEGKSIKGLGFRRIYIFTEAQMSVYMNELTNISAVRDVMAQAHSSGLKN